MIQVTDGKKELESEWVALVRDRFEGDEEMDYASEADFLCLLNAPEQYEVEDEMLEYAKSHPDASMKELVEYFDEIASDGLPPCASEWDDDDDY